MTTPEQVLDARRVWEKAHAKCETIWETDGASEAWFSAIKEKDAAFNTYRALSRVYHEQEKDLLDAFFACHPAD